MLETAPASPAKPSRITAWLLAAFVLLSVALGAEVWILRHDLLRLHRESESEKAASHEQVRTINEKLVASDKARQVAEQKLERRSSAQVGASRTNFGNAFMQTLDRMKHEPGYLALEHRQHEENIQMNYGDLLATLHLPADKLAKLKRLMAERMESAADARSAAKDMGVTDPQSLAAAVKQADDDVSQEINSLLGDADYARFKDFATLQGPLRGVRDQYVTDMAYAGVPMTQDQTVALARIVRDLWDPNTTLNSRDLRVQVIDPQTGYTAIDEELVNRAGMLLSPDQLAVLKASQTVARQRNLFIQNVNKAARAQAAGQ